MALHLPPANIQNECFSERSHLMFCSYDTHGGITLSKTEENIERRKVKQLFVFAFTATFSDFVSCHIR